MKTTLEIPDSIFRRAKAKAAERGIPFRQFVTDAVEEKLRAKPGSGGRPWLEMAGKLRHLRKETARINALIDQEFEVIEPGEFLNVPSLWTSRRAINSSEKFLKPV